MLNGSYIFYLIIWISGRFTDCPVFQNVPPDLAICCFILEQSLSVRALQEMLSNSSVDEVTQDWVYLYIQQTHTVYCLLSNLKTFFLTFLTSSCCHLSTTGCWFGQMGMFGPYNSCPQLQSESLHYICTVTIFCCIINNSPCKSSTYICQEWHCKRAIQSVMSFWNWIFLILFVFYHIRLACLYICYACLWFLFFLLL